MSDTEQNVNEVAIQWTIDVDKKSQDEAKKAGNNMIDLISKLAIIGKVAGEALSKMWAGIQNNISASLDSFEDISLGLSVGVDPEELRTLQYALTQIGKEATDAMPMLTQMDKVIQSFRNPATGADELKKFFVDLSTYGVDKASMDAIEKAIRDEDLVSAIKLLGETRNQLGDEFSNFMNERGMSSLAFLELDYQYEDWIEAWGKSSDRVFQINTEGLDALEDGWSDISTSLKALQLDLSADLGPLLEDLGGAILDTTNQLLDWKDQFKTSDRGEDFGELMTGAVDATKLDMDLISGEIGFLDYLKAKGGSIQDQWNNLTDVMLGRKDMGNLGTMGKGEYFDFMAQGGMSSISGSEYKTEINIAEVTVQSDNAEAFIEELRGFIE